MTKKRQLDSLEDQLREERRLAAAMRRRRRKRWLVPLLLVGIVIIVVILLITQHSPAKESPVSGTEQAADSVATLVFAGDISVDQQMLANLAGKNGFDFTGCFSSLTRTVAAADLAIVNIEGNFCGAPYGSTNASYPETLLDALKFCGFDVIQTANSYSIENGISGLISTKHAIEEAGMIALGTFESEEERMETGGILIYEVNGIRIALIGLTKGTNGLRLPDGKEYCVNLLFEDYDTNYSKIDRSGISELLDNAKSCSPDVIICCVHWGSEFTSEVTDMQRSLAEYLFDSGVDVIVGSHSHLVGPIEGSVAPVVIGTKDAGLVAYSLGDLLSSSDREATHAGCMLCVSFSKTGDVTTLTDVCYIPTYSAYPAEDNGVAKYQVFDVLDAMRLFEGSYYDRIDPALYEILKTIPEILQERTASELQINK